MKRKITTIFLSFIPICVLAKSSETTYNISDLSQNQLLTEKLLIDMLSIERWDLVEKLLPIYQGFENHNQRLVNYAKIKQVQPLLQNYQYKSAREVLQAVGSQKNLTNNEHKAVEQYLTVLNELDSWQFSFGSNYVYNKNVNNATRDRHIENTGFVKNDDMMPKSAKGFAYDFSASRNWNLSGSHNVYFSNELSGKYYWDNHDYDEMTNRTYLGHLYQNAKVKWAFKPFYERQWLGNKRHQWAKGIRAEWQKPFAKEWQISTAFEWSQPRYFSQTEKNGTIKLISATLIWQPSEKGYFYIGSDFIREQTRVKQYSNDTKSWRLGWVNQWKYDIVSQINVAFAHRQFKDFASLGNILPLNKIRQDKIYSAHLTLWKSDWHLWGLTPKIQFKYKRQDSNIASMFSYSEKYVQMLIEKTF